MVTSMMNFQEKIQQTVISKIIQKSSIKICLKGKKNPNSKSNFKLNSRNSDLKKISKTLNVVKPMNSIKSFKEENDNHNFSFAYNV